MDKTEFSRIRHRLGKTQKQLAQLLGTSTKAIQSFEQGWRDIPVSTERQILLLMALKSFRSKKTRPCWAIRRCSEEARQRCPAWEFQAGHPCWFINGTFCEGEVRESWDEKMYICRRCTVFERLLSSTEAGNSAAASKGTSRAAI